MSQTILVVDRSATIVNFVSFCLRHEGYKVITARDGKEAVERIRNPETDVALVVTALNMPNLDGYSLIETVRQREKHKNMPIIILSSRDRDADRERGIALGASAYLVKPFRADRLLAEVSRQLR